MYPFLISVCLRRSLFHLHFGRIILQNIEFQVSEFFFQYFKYFTPLFFPSQFLKRNQILWLHLFLIGKIPPTCSSFWKIFSLWSLIIYNLNNICLSVFCLFVCLFVCLFARYPACSSLNFLDLWLALTLIWEIFSQCWFKYFFSFFLSFFWYSLIIVFILKSIFCLIWVLLLQLSFDFNLHGKSFSIPSLSVCVSLGLKWVSCRQHL